MSRALHPTRIAIVAALRRGDASPVAISREIGETVGAVAYHVRMLRDAGLIVPVEQIKRRGAVETVYRLDKRAAIGFPESLADVAREAADFLASLYVPPAEEDRQRRSLVRRLRRAVPSPTNPTTRRNTRD